METAWWGALVRIGQALLACGPTLLVGWLIAALMERLLGREGTFKLFGGHSWRQLPQAWLIGMLLPVCSLGVIPVLRQMRKSGLSGGTILAFGMTAPLFNPISVLYGLTLSDPFAIFVFCIATLTIVTLLGTLWDALFPRNWIEPEPLPPTPYGVR
ncbi:MAG: permease, partial [Pirellulaceae bacterium]